MQGTLPQRQYDQGEITKAFADVIASHRVNARLLNRFHSNTGVRTRHLALALEQYSHLDSFTEANNAFISVGVELGAEAVTSALKAADLTPPDVDLIISTTITGLAVPSLDARISPMLGLRADVKRIPLVGLGCVAGAAGVARLHDYLLGHPGEVAVLVSVELCSLTVQRHDASVANMVASGLFGDGAAAVVAVGDQHPAAKLAAGPAPSPAVIATRSRLYADTERAMGWDVGSSGLRIVLGAEVPQLVRDFVADDVDGFLADLGLSRADIDWWVCHPGGPKVLEALENALDLQRNDLQLTWDSLSRIGNLSSASVLHVFSDTLATRPPRPGSYGMMMAMGPGFCLELVLLRA